MPGSKMSLGVQMLKRHLRRSFVPHGTEVYARPTLCSRPACAFQSTTSCVALGCGVQTRFWLQVFFESKQEAPLDAFFDMVAQIGEVLGNALSQASYRTGLLKLMSVRRRRNYHKLRASWKGVADAQNLPCRHHFTLAHHCLCFSRTLFTVYMTLLHLCLCAFQCWRL